MSISILVNKIITAEKINLNDLLSSTGKIYTFLNPVSYLIALKYREIFSNFDGIFADGSIMCGAIKLLYGNNVTRRSFDMTSVAPILFDYANEHGQSMCIVATKQEVMEKSVEKFSHKYPKIKWLGCRNGFFSSDDEMRIAAERIAKENPDFLIVGMGAKMQERFLLLCKEAGYQGIGFTCGGFIHQYAMNESSQYYPQWADRMNIRFLYRMYKEPYTIKRYAKAAIIFPIRFLVERITGK